ncbi:uncharacterized protein LOC128559638 [Mercenaria mercenaria]|uniref:uncharacterized protein LOC128559638 n=1 Tax=Mercenaria mercenaria TaxID=6596 RepID=UPI00234EE43F|nr:uncharacterized protein LOC128559638 [Mercenaria mercenaria]
MSEMSPVFSHNTDRHYRNIYCAQCNNDSWNVTGWQTRLQCKNESVTVPEFKISHDFSPSLMIAMNPNCVMLWRPSITEKKVAHCLTNSDIVSECNKPGLDSLCQKYYFPVKGGNKIFRNIFCMECLFPTNLTGKYPFCDRLGNDILNMNFILIMSMDGYPNEISQLVTAVKKCSSGRKYNKELDACIHHTCPVTEVNAIDGCIPLFSEISGFNMDYRLKVLHPKQTQLLLELLLPQVEDTLYAIDANGEILKSEISGMKTEIDFVEVNVKIVKHVNIRTNIKKLIFCT